MVKPSLKQFICLILLLSFLTEEISQYPERYFKFLELLHELKIRKDKLIIVKLIFFKFQIFYTIYLLSL